MLIAYLEVILKRTPNTKQYIPGNSGQYDKGTTIFRIKAMNTHLAGQYLRAHGTKRCRQTTVVFIFPL